ncbi:MAG: ATP-binding cassette domain-containing protein, partial [Pseudomonadota bacterium]
MSTIKAEQPDFFQVNNLVGGYARGQQVINDVSFSVHEGELACLLGPSGCGKTSILR